MKIKSFDTGVKFFAAMLCIVLTHSVFALEAKDIPEVKRTKLNLYLTAPEAAKLKTRLGNKALFLDIRTKGEVMFVGHASMIDAVVPYVDMPDELGVAFDDKNGVYKLVPNNDFAHEVERRMNEKGLTKDDVVILICRSGDRSSKAINVQLADTGYTHVYSVVDGFEGDMSKEGRRTVNGWKNAGLPWSYKLEVEKAYVPK